MKIKRVNPEDQHPFSIETIHRRLGYLIENEHPIFVAFTIFDNVKAIIDPIYEPALEDLIETFRIHNRFITEFYDVYGKKIREFDPIKRIKVNPGDLGVTQWIVSKSKLKALESWVQQPKDVILPVFKYQGRMIVLDGHTRLNIAFNRRMPYVYAYEEKADGLSKAFYTAAIRRGFFSISDVKIVDDVTYKEQWNVFCDTFIQTYREKQSLRLKAHVLRQALTKSEHESINQALLLNLATVLNILDIRHIGIYYPIGKEVDLRILDDLYQTYYPIIEHDMLTFAPNVGAFKNAPFNTHVPDTSLRVKEDLDILIVPGLLFDQDGYRLGYGKGYYDGYLNHYTGLKIGVCFEQFLHTELPRENHDRRVDMIITEKRVIKLN